MSTEDDKKKPPASEGRGLDGKEESFNRIDMTGNVSTGGSSTNKKSSSGDASDLEARREKHRRRAEEERRAKSNSKQGSRKSSSGRGLASSSDASDLEARREKHRRRADEERQAKLKAKGSSSRSSRRESRSSRNDDDRDMELEKRREKNRRRTEEERKAKAGSRRSVRPGAQSASSNDPKSDRARRKQGRSQKSGRSLNDRDDYGAMASNSTAVADPSESEGVVAVTVDENDEVNELKKQMERQNRQMQRQMEQQRQDIARQNEAAAEQQRRQEEERARELEEEKQAKRKKKRCFIWAFVGTVAIAGIATVVALFMGGKDDAVAPSPTATSVDPEPTDPPVNGLFFDPPSEEQCEAISAADETYFDSLLIERDVTLSFKVVADTVTVGDDTDSLFPVFEENVQQTVLPFLAGCASDSSRRLAGMSSSRGLEVGQYFIKFASTGEIVIDDTCTTSDGAQCYEISLDLLLFLNGEIGCDQLTEEINSKLPNLSLTDFTVVGDASVKSCAAITASPTSKPTETVTGTPTVSPSDRPTRAPVVGTFPPTKATPNPTNVPTKAPTPGPTCADLAANFEEALDAEPEETDNKDEVVYRLECPKDFLDMVVLAKANEEEGCEVTCLGHLSPDVLSEGPCADANLDVFSVILQTGNWAWDLDESTLVLGYMDADLVGGMECQEGSLVMVTAAPTKTPTVSPTKTPTVSPSQTPSVSPSKTPTVSPSKTPTVAPTPVPSPDPTPEPTQNVNDCENGPGGDIETPILYPHQFMDGVGNSHISSGSGAYNSKNWFSAYRAIDGESGTRFATDFPSNRGDQWMAVDLGAEYILTGVDIDFAPTSSTNGWKQWPKRYAIEVSNDPACATTTEEQRNCFCDLAACFWIRETPTKKDRSCWTQVYPATGWYSRSLSTATDRRTISTSVSGRYVRLYIDRGTANCNAAACGCCYNGQADWIGIQEIRFNGRKANACEADISPPTSCPAR